MVRYFPFRDLAEKRQRLKILSRYTGIKKPIYSLETETTIITRITKYYTARCTHCFKSRKRAFNKLRPHAAPLKLRKNRYRAKAKPAGCVT